MVTYLHQDFTRYKAKTKERETCINKPVYQQTDNYSALFVCVSRFRKRKRFATLSKQTMCFYWLPLMAKNFFGYGSCSWPAPNDVISPGVLVSFSLICREDGSTHFRTKLLLGWALGKCCGSLWLPAHSAFLQSHSTPASDRSSSFLTFPHSRNVDPSSPGETGCVIEWAQPLESDRL